MEKEKGIFDDAPVIFKYTREQALADGVLVDVSKWAHEVGLKPHTVVTQAVYAEYITPSDFDRDNHGQSEDGRAYDTVWMLRMAIKRLLSGRENQINYQLYYTIDGQQALITLKAHIGPGDNGEPVLTIMQPHED